MELFKQDFSKEMFDKNKLKQESLISQKSLHQETSIYAIADNVTLMDDSFCESLVKQIS